MKAVLRHVEADLNADVRDYFDPFQADLNSGLDGRICQQAASGRFVIQHEQS